jgi:hypothetical protein
MKYVDVYGRNKPARMSDEDREFWYSDRILTDEECEELYNDKSRLHYGFTPIYDQIRAWIQRENAKKVIRKAPQINYGSNYNYTSPIDGRQVTNRQQHLDHCREHDVYAVGNEFSKEK